MCLYSSIEFTGHVLTDANYLIDQDETIRPCDVCEVFRTLSGMKEYGVVLALWVTAQGVVGNLALYRTLLSCHFLTSGSSTKPTTHSHSKGISNVPCRPQV